MSLHALYEDLREHGDYFKPGRRGRIWAAWTALTIWPTELYWRRQKRS